MPQTQQAFADVSSLADDQFALSGRRLRIDDRQHVLMAANAINDIRGVTDEERVKGRIAIAVIADRMGIKNKSIKAANKTHLHFESMAIEMPDVVDHPNRHPFSGIMTRLDIASDFPVGGAKRKVIIPMAVAEAGLASLLGMAIDYKEDFDGHDRKSKIGIITSAYIGEVDYNHGTPLHIEGFFYAADFPKEVSFIQAERDALGFSYEAEATVENLSSDPWTCSTCSFTGAAVLYKNKAAFTKTSIEASKQGDSIMPLTQAEIEAMQKQNAELAASVAKLTDDVAKAALAAEQAAKERQTVEAASLQMLVKPHADALRTCATNMQAAGIGAAAEYGHAMILNKMADQMEAQSILGKVPSTFDSYFYGSADEKAKLTAAAADASIAADKIASQATVIKDLETKVTALEASSATAPKGGRQSLSASAIATLKKIGIDNTGAGISVVDLDAACQKAGLRREDSIALKLNLRAAGALS